MQADTRTQKHLHPTDKCALSSTHCLGPSSVCLCHWQAAMGRPQLPARIQPHTEPLFSWRDARGFKVHALLAKRLACQEGGVKNVLEMGEQKLLSGGPHS